LSAEFSSAGSVYAFLAEHRRRLFPDELFADLFGSGRGDGDDVTTPVPGVDRSLDEPA
jgi:hypothetical protein